MITISPFHSYLVRAWTIMVLLIVFIIPRPFVNSLSLVTFVLTIPLQTSCLHLHAHHTEAPYLFPLRVPPQTFLTWVLTGADLQQQHPYIGF